MVFLDGKMRIVDSQGVKWLLYLLKNEHMSIKNEGIVSLSLLTSLKTGVPYIVMLNYRIHYNNGLLA